MLGALREGGDAGPPAELRRRLAWKAFQHCATYDSTVAEWLWGQIGVPHLKRTYVAILNSHEGDTAYLKVRTQAHQPEAAWEEARQRGCGIESCEACLLLCNITLDLHPACLCQVLGQSQQRLHVEADGLGFRLWGFWVSHVRAGAGAPAPEQSVPMRLAARLRYGENPHQSAAAYLDASLAEVGRGGIGAATQHHGKEVRASLKHILDAKFLYVVGCLQPCSTTARRRGSAAQAEILAPALCNSAMWHGRGEALCAALRHKTSQQTARLLEHPAVAASSQTRAWYVFLYGPVAMAEVPDAG